MATLSKISPMQVPLSCFYFAFAPLGERLYICFVYHMSVCIRRGIMDIGTRWVVRCTLTLNSQGTALLCSFSFLYVSFSSNLIIGKTSRCFYHS